MRVLVLKMGTTEPGVALEHGDYEDWFRLILEASGCEVEVLPVFDGATLPDSPKVDGIVLTGSPLSVRDEATWMQEVGAWTLEQVRTKTPVLAVCFGHQLLGECLGGRVEENPAGPEWGAIEVRVQVDDPLFEGLPDTLCVQASHRDALVEFPQGVRCLASNDNSPLQAFAYGEWLRAVQFHPEARADVIADLLAARGLEGRHQASEHGRKILENWVRHWLA